MRKSALLLGLGGAAAAYALWEPYHFRLVEIDVPVASEGEPLSILHISDAHLTGRSKARARFIASLAGRAGEAPDLVLSTGDMIEDDSGIDLLLEALAPLEARLGKYYVLGSHDYYQAKFKAPTKYFRGKQEPVVARRADIGRLETGMQERGWTGLTNRTELIATGDKTIRLSGVDDPYLGRHRVEHIGRDKGDTLAIGLAHAPDVVSEFALSGYDLLLCGHTHGGQVRFPLVGALVTNSTIPSALAQGSARIGSLHLYVTPGLGTSKFTPIRFLCRPEATLLRLRPQATVRR